jgi:hypothetical protein
MFSLVTSLKKHNTNKYEKAIPLSVSFTLAYRVHGESLQMATKVSAGITMCASKSSIRFSMASRLPFFCYMIYGRESILCH